MRKIVLLVLIMITVSLAINKDLTRIKTVVVDENTPAPVPATTTNTINVLGNGNPYPLLPDYGRTEVIGGTCYDWVNGPVLSWLRNDPNNFLFASWMWSNTEAMSDRNMYCNIYDWSTRTWLVVNNTNYMLSGQPVFPHTLSSVAGGADLDPTGKFVVSGMYSVGGVLSNKLARETDGGTGLFEYSQGPTGYRWPCIGVTQNQNVHVAAIDVATTYDLYYSRTTSPWTTWTPYVTIAPPGPQPYFPDQNIAASKTSNKVIVVWESSNDPYPERAYYTLSTDGGATWGTSTQIPFPPSYGGITPGFNISSLFATFDGSDNFHIVMSVSDTGYTLPAQIWHYCPTNTPAYSLIHHYDAETLNAAVGYNAIFATRPSICRNPSNGYLYVAWEQFDSLNYEPLTTLARADIHIAESRDNGLTWIAKKKITNPNTMSKRFPVVGGVQGDTLLVMYMADSIAGAFLQGEHRYCVNPIVVHRVPVPLTPGIEQNDYPKFYEFALKPAIPNPTRSNTAIRYTLPTTSNVSLSIHDVSGRLVKNLISDKKPAGEYSVVWDGRNESGKQVNAGIYFYTLKSDSKSQTRKLIITN